MSLPSFTAPVPDNGYRWWYLDAVSDDGIHALTVIVFIGSVFSPYYARARKRRGVASALQHCSVNMALYGPVSRWCMTERDEASVQASQYSLAIGRSAISVNAPGKLSIDIDEIAVPVPGRMRGQLLLDLPDYDIPALPLDTGSTETALHYWQPVAPQTRISVMMSKPHLKWTGTAYVDSNYGNAPLEKSFRSWTWSRSHAPENQTVVHYDVVDVAGNSSQRSLQFDHQGSLQTIVANKRHELRPTRYFRMPRSARTAHGVTVSDVQTLEDTPFYSRSRFLEHHAGHTQTTVHESLDLKRFDSALVRCMLPFRMPRTTRSVVRA